MTPGGDLVVDASVAVKWYVPEPDSQRALSILGSGRSLLAPDLLISEVGNILWKKVQRGELTLVEAQTIVTALTTACPLRLHSGVRLAGHGARHRRDVSANRLRFALRRACK